MPRLTPALTHPCARRRPRRGARQVRQHAQVHTPRHRVARRARPAPSPAAAAGLPSPAELTPTYQNVQAWLRQGLATRHASVRLLTRLAVLVTGLVAGQEGTVNGIGRTIKRLRLSGPRPVKRESCSKRVTRMLEDTQFDPDTLLRQVLRPVLPEVLAEVVVTHTRHTEQQPKRHARGRLPLVRLILDETTHRRYGHVLVVGLAYRGIVLPLALRVWAQNEPLAQGAYWGYVQSALAEGYEVLPPALRDHVLVLADRAYGVPRLLDLLVALGWDWALRVQGQMRVRLRDGRILAVRELAPRPGCAWLGGFDPLAAAAPTAPAAPAAVPVDVFRAAGWRQSQVVAVWVDGQDEPWLLVSSLAATSERLLDYARRWAIERLFLSWKSHGWDLETCGVHDPARLGRLLSGYVLATYWRLAAGTLEATLALADLERRAHRRLTAARLARQLLLPLAPSDAPGALPRGSAPRPDAAKHSLFSLGTYAWLDVACRYFTPALCWPFPDWDAPPWGQQAKAAYAAQVDTA